jgi:hypothetical protein
MSIRKGPRRVAMGRAPSGGGGIESAQPMPPRFRSLATKPNRDKARGARRVERSESRPQWGLRPGESQRDSVAPEGPQVRRGAAPGQVLVEFEAANP